MNDKPNGTGPDSSVIYVERGAIATLRLNRPSVRNAIDDDLQASLIDRLEKISTRQDLRAVVLTGEGSSFCAGGDIKAMQRRLEAPPGEVGVHGLRRLRATHRMITLLDDLDKVTVAAVNGAAVGVGMDLALCCDFVIASDAAMFSTSYVLRGLVPDGGGLYYLPRRIGLGRAKELVYTGRRVDAQEALALGIADRVVGADELDCAAIAWATELIQGSSTAIGLAKAILNRTFELTREEVLARSASAQAICYSTAEHREAVEKFLDESRDNFASDADRD